MSCKFSTHSFPLVAPFPAARGHGWTAGRAPRGTHHKVRTAHPPATSWKSQPANPKLSPWHPGSRGGQGCTSPSSWRPGQQSLTRRAPPAPSHAISPAPDEASPKAQVPPFRGLISCAQLALLPEEPQRPVAVTGAQEDYQNYNRDLQRKPSRLSQATQTRAKLFIRGYCSNAFQIKLSGVRWERSVLWSVFGIEPSLIVQEA